MKKLIWAAILVAVWAIGAGMGSGYRAWEIQATCEDDNGRTVINGTPYVCLSARQLRMLSRQPDQET
ncbi:hypothetical protein [Burkholderia ubonensis]|uniref:hypothetical protein n=1 Tax=Burkholderia ubonensis TaxID=101571 RepID=UPI00075AF6C5|nr:hypothetical protein [Burkholderia ubonensis]AOI70863.1 hypothetical protein WI31_15695 [Burkholderia ubonensis]KUZ07408.1 hypothetical protein WI29_34150 [Burkholderia ubonensis]KUZ20648.1 hypothetical protein WI30_01335 [Burkholderia ubonensis]KUZ42051.1 hypothetical protein WI32_03160 [Burkholderia ubonensis]KUZ56857.1 hypothetical protein WI33_04695 [Burkholderia ubonensis]